MTAFNADLSAPGDANRVGKTIDQASFTNPNNHWWIGQYGNGSDRQGGVVFVLNIPQGATIDDASLDLWNDSYEAGFGSSVVIDVWGDAGLTQANFSSTDLPHNITKTTATDSITNPNNTTGEIFSFDVAAIIEEIVGDAGWTSGDLIRFFFDHNAAGNYQYRTVTSAGAYADSAQEPDLSGNYTEAASGASLITPPLHRLQLRHALVR